MRAIVAQLQLHRPPVSNLRDLCALTRDQLTQVLHLSLANVGAEDFHRAVAAISSAEKSNQKLPPSPPHSARDAPSFSAWPLNFHEHLPFFVYGTLCSGFGNCQRLIEVTPRGVHLARKSLMHNNVNTAHSLLACKLDLLVFPITLSSTSPTEATQACLLPRPICCLRLVAEEMWHVEKYLESWWMPVA